MSRSPKFRKEDNLPQRERIHLVLLEDARRGFEDVAAGRFQDADTALARIQRCRAAKAKGKTTRHG